MVANGRPLAADHANGVVLADGAVVLDEKTALLRPPTVGEPPRRFPQCWGHRGASAAYPENTLASFEAAIRDGSEGIESDVHISSDGVVVMHHDTHLDRTTNGSGLIFAHPYRPYLSALHTKNAPHQPIPTFAQTLALLMAPENAHVVLNIDCKVDNDPARLFALLDAAVRAHPTFEADLAPRLILGLWHPKYLEPARRLVPYMRRIHIGVSPAMARRYFWDGCEGFSINFAALVTRDGEAFRRECAQGGKDVYVWTVNKRAEMIEATKWGCRAVLTDRTDVYFELRENMKADWAKVARETSWMFGWTSVWYLSIVSLLMAAWEEYILTRTAGRFQPVLEATEKAH